jgi:glyoxylase-like metal-dependent hydrolase (beta-lactamase superfamily II)
VFGDGTVVIKFTPGHTPSHQSLFLKLAETAPVLLSGDLYHYPEELTLKRVPSFDFDKEQAARSRAVTEDFVKKTGARLRIQHDAAGQRQKRPLRRSEAHGGYTGRSFFSTGRLVSACTDYPLAAHRRAGKGHLGP